MKPDTFSLLYVFVIVLGLDPAQATVGLEKMLEQLTNRNIPIKLFNLCRFVARPT